MTYNVDITSAELEKLIQTGHVVLKDCINEECDACDEQIQITIQLWEKEG